LDSADLRDSRSTLGIAIMAISLLNCGHGELASFDRSFSRRHGLFIRCEIQPKFQRNVFEPDVARRADDAKFVDHFDDREAGEEVITGAIGNRALAVGRGVPTVDTEAGAD